MRIATRNVERLKHRSELSAIIGRCKESGADILVLTETDKQIHPAYKYCNQTPPVKEVIPALYKSRDASEKLFRGDKSYLGERSMRTYHDDPTHVKNFIEFIALIIRNKIYTCLKNRMKELKKKKNCMTVPAALKELDKIEIIRQMDGVYRLDHAVTAMQKDILQAFNMTEATVKKEAGILGEQLRCSYHQ